MKFVNFQSDADYPEDNLWTHLVPRRPVGGHMAIQLRAVGESVAAELAGKALLVLLMPVLDVLLEGGQSLVAPVAVWAGQQLGKVIWRPECQICTKRRRTQDQQSVSIFWVIRTLICFSARYRLL